MFKRSCTLRIQNAYIPRPSSNIPERFYNKNHIRITSQFIQIYSVGVKPERRRLETEAKSHLLRGHPCGEVRKCKKYYEMNQNI
jgi:hypothetical protein